MLKADTNPSFLDILILNINSFWHVRCYHLLCLQTLQRENQLLLKAYLYIYKKREYSYEKQGRWKYGAFTQKQQWVGGIRRDDLITDSDVFWKKRMRTNKLSAQESVVAFSNNEFPSMHWKRNSKTKQGSLCDRQHCSHFIDMSRLFLIRPVMCFCTFRLTIYS